MSDKAEKKADAKEGAAPAAPGAADEKKAGKGGLLKSTPILLGVVMVVEAVILFGGFKMLGGGAKPAQAADLATSEEGEAATDGHDGGHGDAHGEAGHGDKAAAKSTKKGKFAEVPVLRFRAQNKRSGRSVLYDVGLAAVVKSDFEERVKTMMKDREATLQDRMRTIIAQSEPEKLDGGVEPGLETLRRQVKYQLDEMLGEGVIEEVLVTQCTPLPGY